LQKSWIQNFRFSSLPAETAAQMLEISDPFPFPWHYLRIKVMQLLNGREPNLRVEPQIFV
jgi:hypothetical protein